MRLAVTPPDRDRREWGAYIVMDPDGTVRIGPSGIGVIGEFDFGILGPMPASTIAELHIHPDNGDGSAGSPPFTSDLPSVRTIYGIVMNRDYIWVLTPWSPPGYCFPRLDGGPACLK